MARLQPFFPKSHGVPQVDDRRVLSGIVFINRNGLRWCDAPKEYGPPKTLYNRWKRWGDMGVFRSDHGGPCLRGGGPEDGDDRCDLFESAPHGDQPAVEKGGSDDRRGRLIGRTKGGMNTKLHAVTDANGPAIRFFMTAGQVSDYTGAAALMSSLPKAEWLQADRGYDTGLVQRYVSRQRDKPCIPGRKSRSKPVKHDKRRYKRRNRIEIVFGRPNRWRRVATRYGRCPKVFLSAVALAATVMFWL